jgi:hypothetical protein
MSFDHYFGLAQQCETTQDVCEITQDVYTVKNFLADKVPLAFIDLGLTEADLQALGELHIKQGYSQRFCSKVNIPYMGFPLRDGGGLGSKYDYKNSTKLYEAGSAFAEHECVEASTESMDQIRDLLARIANKLSLTMPEDCLKTTTIRIFEPKYLDEYLVHDSAASAAFDWHKDGDSSNPDCDSSREGYRANIPYGFLATLIGGEPTLYCPSEYDSETNQCITNAISAPFGFGAFHSICSTIHSAPKITKPRVLFQAYVRPVGKSFRKTLEDYNAKHQV